MCDFIQNYIKDGKYIHTSEVYPSCVFPHGSVSTGNTVITSTYECGNPGKFLQKNFTTVSLNSEEGTVTQIQKYDIECAWLLATTTGYSLTGKFRYCSKNNNIFICSRGYSRVSGKIETIRTYLDTTPTGYVETSYSKINGVWTPTIKRTYTRVSP